MIARPGATSTIAVASTCTACGLCIVTCPERALERAPQRPSPIASRCTACMACVEVCPVDAIDVRRTAPGASR